MRHYRVVARTLVIAASIVSVLVATAGVLPVGASGHLTTINDWQTIAPGGREKGLGVDNVGNLLSFSLSGQLSLYSKLQLATAMAGVPLSSASRRLATVDSLGRGAAGIVVASDGTIYFDTGASNTIWELVTNWREPRALPLASNSLTRFTGLELSNDERFLYAADQRLGRVYRINLSTMQVAVVFDSNGDQLEQMAMDLAGNLDVVGLSGAVYSIAAGALAKLTVGTVLTKGHGATVIAYLGEKSYPSGLTIDGADNVYVSTCAATSSPHPAISVITESASSTARAHGIPATVINGGVVPIADTWSEPSFGCIDALAVADGILYAGDWRNAKIWGLPLRDLGKLVSLAPAATGDVQLTRTASTLLATWSAVPNAIDYVCTLMDSATVSSSIRETTISNACWFGGLSVTQRVGVRVVANGASSEVVGYAPPPDMTTITCTRGSITRRVQSYAPRCPAGYSRVR